MKETTLAPFHLFQYRGNNYAFEIESSAVMRLDDAAYDALKMRQSGALDDTMRAQLSTDYGPDQADTVLNELLALEQTGMLRGPVSTYDDEENETYIQRLTRMSTNKVEIYLAEACNLRCRYCYVGRNDALNNGLMPWDVAKQSINFVFQRSANSDSVHITFFGGEPLMNKPVLRRAIEYSQWLGHQRGKKVTYSMTTNATLLDEEIIDYIVRYNFGLMISMDGPPDVQDHMRPTVDGEGSFELAATNLRKLMARRRSVTVRSTLSKHCLDRPRIVEFLEDFGFSRVAMSRCSGTVDEEGPYDIGPEETAVLQSQDDYFIDRLFGQLERGERVRFDPWASSVRFIHDRSNRRMRCGVGRGCTTVGMDGNLYPCHRYVGMDNYILGTVTDGIDRERFADYLRGYFSTKSKCESCWAINICGGYCPWYVSGQDGTFQPPQDWWCDEVRGWLEQGIWVYDTLRSEYPAHFAHLVGEEVVGAPVLR